MRRLPLILVLLLGTFACQRAEPTALLDLVNSTNLRTSEASVDEVLSKISQSFATAMSDEDVRLDVRDAMRRSPWGQHVVDLNQFLQSSRGARASSRMSEVRGESVDQLHRVVESLQPLDLYIPSGVMRRTWSGSADIGVYASLDFEDGAVFGYGIDTRPLTYQPGRHEANFLIEPARRRIERYDIDPGDSTFVEGPNEIAMFSSWSDADGNLVEETTYADLVREGRIPEAGGPQMAPSNGSTRVTEIGVDFCDGAAGLGGDLEIRLTARFYAETGSFIGSGIFYDPDVPPPGGCGFHTSWAYKTYLGPVNVIIPWVLPPGQDHYITVEMVEEDTWPDGDDYIGSDGLTVTDHDAVFDYQNQGICHFGINCGSAKFSYPTLATAVLTYVELPVVVIEGYPKSVVARPLDQYRFPILGYSASGWGTDHPWIATASGAGGKAGLVTGVSAGQTYYFATINGILGGNTVIVIDCEDEDLCD